MRTVDEVFGDTLREIRERSDGSVESICALFYQSINDAMKEVADACVNKELNNAH